MKKTLTVIAALFALTGCSPVITNLVQGPNDAPVQEPAAVVVQTPNPITPLYVIQTCPRALETHPDIIWLATHCTALVQAAALATTAP